MSSIRSSRPSCAGRRRRPAAPATACFSATARATSGSSANISRTWSPTASRGSCSRRPATVRATVSSPLLRGGFPLVLIDRALPDTRLRPDRQRQRVGRATPGRASDRGRPSPHRACHRRRRHLDRPRAAARLSRGARSGRHRAIARSSSSAPPSISIGGYRATQQVLGARRSADRHLHGQQHDGGRRDAGAPRARPGGPATISAWSASTTSSTWRCCRRS